MLSDCGCVRNHKRRKRCALSQKLEKYLRHRNSRGQRGADATPQRLHHPEPGSMRILGWFMREHGLPNLHKHHPYLAKALEPVDGEAKALPTDGQTNFVRGLALLCRARFAPCYAGTGIPQPHAYAGQELPIPTFSPCARPFRCWQVGILSKGASRRVSLRACRATSAGRGCRGCRGPGSVY